MFNHLSVSEKYVVRGNQERLKKKKMLTEENSILFQNVFVNYLKGRPKDAAQDECVCVRRMSSGSLRLSFERHLRFVNYTH